MVRGVNSDGIDESQWIPKNEPVVNAHRLAKGDLAHDGKDIRSKYGLPRLLEIHAIDSRQLWAAQSIKTLHEVAFMFLSYRAPQEILAAIHGEVKLDIPPPMDIYLRVMRSLNAWQRNIVERVCLNELRPNDYNWIYHCRASVQTTFDKVADSLDLITNPPPPPESYEDQQRFR